MTYEEPLDPRPDSSRLDAIAYVESILADLLTLASPEPLLRYMLEVAHLEAINAVRRLKSHQTPDADPDLEDHGLPKEATVHLAS